MEKAISSKEKHLTRQHDCTASPILPLDNKDFQQKRKRVRESTEVTYIQYYTLVKLRTWSGERETE